MDRLSPLNAEDMGALAIEPGDLPRVKREQRLRLASPNRSFGLEQGFTGVRATG
jgi:hypothetical protein